MQQILFCICAIEQFVCYSSEAQGLDLVCVALGDGGTGWALDSSGSLWFRTGVTSSHPQGEDDHWWQVKPLLDNNNNNNDNDHYYFISYISNASQHVSQQLKSCLVCLPQISISDYVVFDQCSLFQTLLQATQSVATATRAPVERVVAFLSQYTQCQPSLVSATSRGVWVASGRNQLHLARGSLVGQ